MHVRSHLVCASVVLACWLCIPTAAVNWSSASNILSQTNKFCQPEALPAEARCEYVRTHREECSPRAGLIDYLSVYYCWGLQYADPLASLLTLLWLGILFLLMFTASDRFFCPAMELLSQYLRLSPAVAGATLLALGNGACDVFTQIAAASSGASSEGAPVSPESLSMALSEPLGTGLFVGNVVLGLTVAMAKGTSKHVLVKPKFFLKDVLFYLCALCTLFYCLLTGKVYFWQCLVLIASWVVYVVLTILLSKDEQTVQLDPLQHEVPRLVPYGPWDDLDSVDLEDWDWHEALPDEYKEVPLLHHHHHGVHNLRTDTFPIALAHHHTHPSIKSSSYTFGQLSGTSPNTNGTLGTDAAAVMAIDMPFSDIPARVHHREEVAAAGQHGSLLPHARPSDMLAAANWAQQPAWLEDLRARSSAARLAASRAEPSMPRHFHSSDLTTTHSTSTHAMSRYAPPSVAHIQNPHTGTGQVPQVAEQQAERSSPGPVFAPTWSAGCAQLSPLLSVQPPQQQQQQQQEQEQQGQQQQCSTLPGQGTSLSASQPAVMLGTPADAVVSQNAPSFVSTVADAAEPSSSPASTPRQPKDSQRPNGTSPGAREPARTVIDTPITTALCGSQNQPGRAPMFARVPSKRQAEGLVSLVRQVSHRHKYTQQSSVMSGDTAPSPEGSVHKANSTLSLIGGVSLGSVDGTGHVSEELYVPLLLEGNLDALNEALDRLAQDKAANACSTPPPSPFRTRGASPAGSVMGASPPGLGMMKPVGTAVQQEDKVRSRRASTGNFSADDSQQVLVDRDSTPAGTSPNHAKVPTMAYDDAALAVEQKRLKKLLYYGLQQKQKAQQLGTSDAASLTPGTLQAGCAAQPSEPDTTLSFSGGMADLHRKQPQHLSSPHCAGGSFHFSSSIANSDKVGVQPAVRQCQNSDATALGQRTEAQATDQQVSPNTSPWLPAALPHDESMHLYGYGFAPEPDSPRGDSEGLLADLMPVVQPHGYDGHAHAAGCSTHGVVDVQNAVCMDGNDDLDEQLNSKVAAETSKRVQRAARSRTAWCWLLWRAFRRPVVLLLSFTMPMIERRQELHYRKLSAVLFPMVGPLLAALYAGWWSPYADEPQMLGPHETRMAMLLCGCTSLAVLLFWPTDGLLQGPILGVCTLLSFLGSMLWMNVAADELVGLLVAIGHVLRLPAALLGATVLAWGNSLSDAVSNTTMARDGYPTMAITACFASPLFILLAGVATTLSVGSLQGPLAMPHDGPTMILYATSTANMLMWGLAVTCLFKFKMDGRVTIIGCTFYVLFQVGYVTYILLNDVESSARAGQL